MDVPGDIEAEHGDDRLGEARPSEQVDMVAGLLLSVATGRGVLA